MLIGIDASRATAAYRTGTEAYSLQLIRALLSQPSQHQFRLYFSSPPAAGLLPPAEQVESRIIPFPRLWTHLRLGWELVRLKPDVLFVPSHVLPLIFPGRAVATVHDLGYRRFPQAHPATSRLYLDWSTRWNLQRSSIVIADSEATRQDIVDFYHPDSSKIQVIYPGYDETLSPVRDPDRLASVQERHGIQGDYLLFVGTLQPRKNLIRLIDAYLQLPDVGRPVQLVLAGKPGWLVGPILDRAQSAGVVLPGFVADEDKAALLSGAAAFCFPSLHEGFGFPVLEAMACGTPVVCSNTSSLPEVAGDAALLVPPDDTAALTDAMFKLLTDQALCTSLARRGLENLERFSWDECARQVLILLEESA